MGITVCHELHKIRLLRQLNVQLIIIHKRNIEKHFHILILIL